MQLLLFPVFLILTYPHATRSENKDADNVDLDKNAVNADWAKMLKEGEEQKVGAYDTGKIARKDHTPLEAFVTDKSHMHVGGRYLH